MRGMVMVETRWRCRFQRLSFEMYQRWTLKPRERLRGWNWVEMKERAEIPPVVQAIPEAAGAGEPGLLVRLERKVPAEGWG